MALRGFWRKVAGFSCFLLIVGLFEFVMVVQLQNSLRTEEKEDGTPLVRALEQARIQSPWHVKGWQSRTQQEERGQEDENEARKARELHNLRADRLNNFRKRAGSLLADEQPQNRLPEPEEYEDNEHRLEMELEKKWQSVSQLLGEGNVSLKINETLKEEFVRLWKMLRMEEGIDHLEEKDSEEYSEEDEEEYEDERSFDPNDFEVFIGEDGRMHVRKKLNPEILVENCSYPIRNMTQFEREGGNILLSIRYSHNQE